MQRQRENQILKGFPASVQGINYPVLVPLKNSWGADLWLLKSDVTGAHLGGNKFHKLSGYLAHARATGLGHLITVAGAHSNHLRAFAALKMREGFRATVIIRGEELSGSPEVHSDAIRYALQAGVDCRFIERSRYRALRTADLTQVIQLLPEIDFANAVYIPEGGRGFTGVTGVAGWAGAATGFAAIWLPCATGTTAAGFLTATDKPTQIMGVQVLQNAPAIKEAIRLFAPAESQRFSLIETEENLSYSGNHLALIAIAQAYTRLWGITIDSQYMARTVMALEKYCREHVPRGRLLLVQTYNE